MILDHPVIAERYFFPRRAPLADPFVVSSNGSELHCYRRIAADGAPMLVHFHGNGEVVADWIRDWPDVFADLGISTLFAEYRGYGGSTGSAPALFSMLDDAVKIANASGAPAERTVAYGRSVGSIYALHVASELGLAGLVIESGIADVGERLLLRMEPAEIGATKAELDAALAEAVDHQQKMAGFAGEVLVLHAEGDDLVPPDHGERLAEWAGDNATLELFARGDHNTIHAYNGEEIIALTAALVKRATGG